MKFIINRLCGLHNLNQNCKTEIFEVSVCSLISPQTDGHYDVKSSDDESVSEQKQNTVFKLV